MIYMMSGLVIACCTTLIIISTISYVIRRKARLDLETAVRSRHDYEDRVNPFEAAAYLSRLEKAYLHMLETAQPVDWTIVLWLGLDGLRIDPDGTTEWIKRSGPGPQSGGGGGTAGAVWDPDILALSGPLPPYRLPTPPPPVFSVLYADNRAMDISAPCDSTMSIQAQMDKLRTEMAIMSLQTQIQQTCVTPPLYPGCMKYPPNRKI